MKFNFQKYWLILTLGGLALMSCEDYLDRKPLTAIGNEAYWQTPKDLETYMLQFYPVFPAFSVVGSYHGLIGWDGTRGTDTQITGVPSTTWNGSRAPVTSGGSWAWQNIRSVNIFFENYRKVNAPFDSYKHYVGEAHFFKAWFYFEKVAAFGDVPWLTHSLQTDSEDLYKARDPRTVVVDSILWNLDRAIEYLDPRRTVAGGNSRLNKEAALLFKSRVALFEGSWQKYHQGTPFGTPGADPNRYFRAAAAAAEELIKGDYTRDLYSTGNPEEDYCKLFSLRDHSSNPEVFLWKKYDVTLGMGHSFQIYVSDRTAGNAVTFEQIQHYLDRQGKPYDYRAVAQTAKGNAFLQKIGADADPRLSQTVWIPGMVMWDNDFGKGVFDKPFLDKSGEYLNHTGFQLRKGNDPKDPQAGSGVSWNTNSMTGAIIFRFAEALLNYAEAKFELGEPVDYEISLNLLRRRVGMPDFQVQSDPNRSYFADYGYSIPDELYEIRRERAVELGCEGFRFDDIRRWRAHQLMRGKRPKGYPYAAGEWAGVNINYVVDADGFLDPYAPQLPSGYGFRPERDYLDNIPLNELTLNPNLTQNPGW